MTSEELKEYARLLYDNIDGWENRTIERIGKRIKLCGQLSAANQQALKNIADISGDMKEITKDLAQVTGMNISEIQKIYTKATETELGTYKPLYDFRGIPYTPFEKNQYAQNLVIHYAKQTAGEMINLSRTKGLVVNSYNLEGKLVNSETLKGFYQSAIDKAVFNVNSGVQDFNSAMRNTVQTLGNGIRIGYGSGVTRSVEAMVRQNMLYGVKQIQESINASVGEELGCDGFEVSFSATCRPSHAFMEGQMFSYKGDVTIDGITYPDGTEALECMNEYGCNHRRTDVILGISNPRYDKEAIAEKQRRNEELLEFNGKTRSRYDWIQEQRKIERAVRKEKKQETAFRSAGNNAEASRHRAAIRELNRRYDEMTNSLDLQPTKERMTVTGYGRKTVSFPRSIQASVQTSEVVDKMRKSDTIKLDIDKEQREAVTRVNDLLRERSEDWDAFKAYTRAVESGELTPLADFDLYRAMSKEIDTVLVGKTTSNGIVVSGKSYHFIARTIGSVEQKRNGVDVQTSLKTILNPIKVDPVTQKPNGSIQRFIGKGAAVTINPQTGRLIQVNPLKSN